MTILSEVSRQRVYGWILKQIHEMNFPLERGCQAFLHLDHQERVPANIKKFVMDANVLHLQYCLPHARDLSLEFSDRGAAKLACDRILLGQR